MMSPSMTPRVFLGLTKVFFACVNKIISFDLTSASTPFLLEKHSRLKRIFACKWGLFDQQGMLHILCNATARIQKNITKSLASTQQKSESMVMISVENIVNGNQMVEDNLVKLKEVFHCLKRVQFECKLVKSDSMEQKVRKVAENKDCRGNHTRK